MCVYIYIYIYMYTFLVSAFFIYSALFSYTEMTKDTAKVPSEIASREQESFAHICSVDWE